MLSYAGTAKYICQSCKKKFYKNLYSGGFIPMKGARPLEEVKCPHCGCKNVKAGLLSKIIFRL